MRLTHWSLHCAAGACGVLLIAFIRLALPPTTVSAAPVDPVDAVCAMKIADVTGDGVDDVAVSLAAASNGAVTAYIVAGQAAPSPIVLDATYVRRHMAGILRGPAAVPFVCGSEPGPRTAGLTAPARVRRHGPVVHGVLDEPVHYRLVDLGPLSSPQYPDLITATRISSAGHVVGSFYTDDGFEHAFFYDGEILRDLGTLGGHLSYARGINGHGNVVGYSLTGATDSFGFIFSGFVSDGFGLRGLDRDWSAASGINDAGQIVGEARFVPGVDLLHAFLHEGATFRDLGSLPPLATTAYSAAHSINESGTIVGESNTYTLGSLSPTRRFSATRAFVYADGSMRDLGSLGVTCVRVDDGAPDERCNERSVATDINNSGTVVGFSTTATNGRGHAFTTDSGSLRDLGALGGSASFAYGINDSGQIVGGFSNADDTYYAPFVYERGTMHDLNELIENPSSARALPWAAYDINNFGQILGNHHILNPIYERVTPLQRFTFAAGLGRTLTFAYWVSRQSPGECHATRSRLRLEVGFDTRDNKDTTKLAEVVRDCGDSTDWHTVSVRIPRDLRGDEAVISVRLRELGPGTNPAVYLRHFSME
jgi:probable HAF family extracellular repeat protein